MDYGSIVRRAAEVVWERKFLIVLGILASLGGGSSGTFTGGGGGGGGGGSGNGGGQPPFEPGQLPQISDEIAGMAIGIVIAIICVVAVVGLLIWAISTLARGGLIAGVDAIESGEKTGFAIAWSAAWQRVWTLLGIGLLPAIPGLILLATALVGLGAYGGLFALTGEDIAAPVGWSGLALILGLLVCIVLPIALALSVLRTFAERAAMLENLGVVDAYRRGWQVLVANLGQAVVLFLLQVGIGIVVAMVLFLPSLLLVFCCFLWPLLLAVQGAISAFVSALWTLAYRTWTGRTTVITEKPAPA